MKPSDLISTDQLFSITEAAPGPVTKRPITPFGPGQTQKTPTNTQQYSQEYAGTTQPAPTQAAPTQAATQSSQPTYNVPTGSLPPVSNTMPQNMGTDPNAAPAATQPAAPAKKNGILRGVTQGVKNLLDPNARAATAASKTASTVRSNAVKRELVDFQSMVQGFDPADTESYRTAFTQWAGSRYPYVPQDTLDAIANSIDPAQPATFTKAITSAYNTQMTANAQKSPQARHLQDLAKQAKDQALMKRLQQDFENPMQVTKNITNKAMASGDLNGMMTPQASAAQQTAPAPETQLEPQTSAPEEQEILDNIKTLQGTQAKLMQQLGAIRSQTQRTAPKTGAGPVPSDAADFEARARSEWEAQHPGLPYPVKESKNFSGILWQQMRDGK